MPWMLGGANREKGYGAFRLVRTKLPGAPQSFFLLALPGRQDRCR
jgi:hypothetical protein